MDFSTVKKLYKVEFGEDPYMASVDNFSPNLKRNDDLPTHAYNEEQQTHRLKKLYKKVTIHDE